jgi:hypothetical protein
MSAESLGSEGGGEAASGWLFAAAPDSLLFRQIHVTCGGNVLIVGDSHILLCGADKAFPGYDVSARFGRDSNEGMAVVEANLRPDHEVVVFDLSTNDVLDPPALEANLDLLLNRTGERQLVLVNTWRQDFRDLHLRVNEILRKFADRHPDRVALVDWAAFIDAHPSPHGRDPDYIHFSTEVYEARITVVSSAIEDALDRAGCGQGRSDATAS